MQLSKEECQQFTKLFIPTDNVKLMISSLSLLLNQDLEEYISPTQHCINLEQIYREAILPLNNGSLNDYIERIMTYKNIPYSSDYLENRWQRLSI